MMPQLVTGLFALTIICLAIWKPQAGRIAMGVFYLLMAVGVNLPLLLLDPGLYPMAGAKAMFPLYRWFFTIVLSHYPVPFIIALIMVEISIGILILSKGMGNKLGLIAGILFCLLIAPVGIEEITAPLIAVGLAMMLRRDYHQSLLEMIKRQKALKVS